MQSCATGGVSLEMWTKIKPSNKMLAYKITTLINDRHCGDFKGFKA